MEKIIRLFAGLCAIAACSAELDYASLPPTGQVHGSVTDMEGNPLNHIKVTLNYGEDIEQMSVYTSLKGEFIADINPSATMLTITLEDIDGEENGGLFESLTDQVIILDNDIFNDEDIMNIEYSLTRATASENIPQS